MSTLREVVERRESSRPSTVDIALLHEPGLGSSQAGGCREDRLFPINALRNAALDQVRGRSALVFLVDVDLAPGR